MKKQTLKKTEQKAKVRAKIKENQKRIKEIRQEIKALKKAKAKAEKQRAKALKAKQNLTPEQKQILRLTEEMQLLKFAVRTLILKDIETVKALKTYEKMINLIVDKMADAKKRK